MAGTATETHSERSQHGEPRAARLVTQANMHGLWPEVRSGARGILAKEGLRVSDDDLRSAYNLAWHVLNSKLLAGETIHNPPGFLAQITHRRVLDDLRAQHQDRVQLVDVTQQSNIFERHDASSDDPAEHLDNLAELRAMAEAIADQVLFPNERDRQLVTLIVVHEYSRPQAAAQLGLSAKRVEKIMDGTPEEPGLARKLTEIRALIRQGGWCESRRSLMIAYAEKLHPPGSPRHQAALKHLQHCVGCRAMLRAREVASLLLPPLPIEVVAADDSRRSAILEAFAHTAAARTPGSGTAHQLAEVAAGHGSSTADVLTTAAAAGGVGGGAAAAGSALLGGAAGVKVLAACLAAGAVCGGAWWSLDRPHAPPRSPAKSSKVLNKTRATRTAARRSIIAPSESTPSITARRAVTTTPHKSTSTRKSSGASTNSKTAGGSAAAFSFEATPSGSGSGSSAAASRKSSSNPSTPGRSGDSGAAFAFEG